MRYLGGMVLTGAAGEWPTGLGNDLDLANVVLVGGRDFDLPEQARITSGLIAHVGIGPDLPRRLTDAIGGRPIYIHLDCDVLDAGLLATEYQSPGGLTFAGLAAAFDVLAQHDVVGLEIAEYETCWPDGRPNDSSELVRAIEPVLLKLRL